MDSVSALLVEDAKSNSDDDDDLVPLASLVAKEKLDVLAAVSTKAASIVYPVGEAAIGVQVARDFGGKHGICNGKITTVNLTGRRPLYHCVYTDGDEEDYNQAELRSAIDLHFDVQAGRTKENQSHDDEGIYLYA